MSNTRHFAPEILGPSLDTTGGEVQQPGVIRAGEPEGHMSLQHEGRNIPGKTADQAAEKFAIRAFIIPDTQLHQLLPVDRHRKIARISAITQIGGQFGFFVGTEGDIGNFAGTQGAAFRAVPNCWWVPGINLGGGAAGQPVPFVFTAKSSLWYCAATTGDVNQTILQAEIEHYEGGTPVT